MGRNTNSTFCSKPTKVDGLCQIVSVSSGWAHNLAIDKYGKVWSWGANRHGQLGNNTTTNSTQPSQISKLERIIRVACGSTHSVAIDQTGKLFIWGSAADGKLGFGVNHDLHEPTHLDFADSIPIVNADCGADHTVAVTKNGQIYGWGFGQHGALADAQRLDRPTPHHLSQIPHTANNVQVCCGMDLTVLGYP